MVKKPFKPSSTKHVPGREDLTKFFGVQECLSLFDVRKQDMRRILVLEEQAERFKSVLRWCGKRGLTTKTVSFDELSRFAGSDHHEGVCIEATPLPLTPMSEMLRKLAEPHRAVVLLLEGVENPHNVGAILRTACFFGVSAVIIQSQVMNALSGAACRIAEGAAERMIISLTKDYKKAFASLKAGGFSFFATTPHQARSIYSVKWPDKAIIMFGAEGSGLSREALAVADTNIGIPRLGQMESLNVGAAVSAVLTEARREAVIKGTVRRIH
jgi:TrmH RNA methyltransferase